MKGARSIAAAQTVPLRGDVDANLAEHVRLARLAAREGARVLVFPELSLTGYELDLAPELTFAEDDPRIAPLVDLASALSMTLVVGAPARIESRLHVGAFVLAPDRSVALYTKRHLGAFPPGALHGCILPPAEVTVFDPGERDPLVRLDGHVAAVAICADASRSTHAARAAERGATVYLASVFVVPTELGRELAKLRRHAALHSMAVAMANFGGPSGGLESAGSSAIWSDTGTLLASLEGPGSGIVLAIEDGSGWRADAIPLAPAVADPRA